MKLSIEKMHEQGRPDSVNLSNSNGDWVAECGAWTNREAQANAAEIVRRVNAFDELREKLAAMCREWETEDHNVAYPECNCFSHQQYESARALLASLE